MKFEYAKPHFEVLFIEDNPTDALLIAEALRDAPFPHVKLTHCERLGDALAKLAKQRFDAALLDLSLPDSRGIQTVERIRLAASELPLIVLTGTNDVELVTSILARGAQDYVLKQDVEGQILAKAIFFAVERHRVTVELERNRRELEAREARIREQAALIHAARDSIMVTDLQGIVVFWNESAERILGWSADEVIGKSVRDFLIADSNRFQTIWNELEKSGEWREEIGLKSKKGGEVLTDSRLSLVQDDQGHPKTILAISTDITERKKLETRFLRAQRMESIGSLAGGIAHDLNNVLAPITMATSLLRDKVKDAEGRHLIETVATSAQRGADMVRQVLTFARGVEGKRATINPGQLLEELARIFNDTFLKSISIRKFVAPDTFAVSGDRTQLHQVLLNLGVNARDAMPQGGELSLSAGNVVLDQAQAIISPDAKPGSYVVLTISDTGIGMSAEVLDRLFDPFFTTKEIGKGTGLGLATARGIVKSHGGFITVYSEEGRGTTFKVYLPALDVRGDEMASSPTPNLPRGNSELVLIVDDEESIRQITKFTLEAFGYRTLVANDGTQALALYAQRGKDIAVVLTDMMMPTLDGAATIRALRAMNPEVKTIAASGLGNGAQCHAATAAGCHQFLHKPYTAEALLEAIHTALHGPDQTRR